jgi:hypothetical protein
MNNVSDDSTSGLTHKSLRALTAYLKKHFENVEAPLFTFLSGSKTEGLSTPSSDYDVYAVYDNCEEKEILLDEFQQPIEITFLSRPKLIKIFKFISTGKDLSNASPYELLLCHRILTGIALTGAEHFEVFKNMLAPLTFRLRLSQICQLYTERSLKACSGNLQVQDFPSALANCTHALKQAFNILLINAGSTSILEKWQMAYGKKYLGAHHPAYVRFIQLLSRVPYDNEKETEAYIGSCFQFQQVVCDYLRFQTKDLGAFEWSTRLFGIIEPEENALKKSATSRVIETHGSFYLIASSTPLLELPEIVADLWALIDNATSVEMLACCAQEKLGIQSNLFYEFLQSLSNTRVLSLNQFNFKNYKALP